MKDPTKPTHPNPTYPDDRLNNPGDEVDPSLAATGEYPHLKQKAPSPDADGNHQPSPETEHLHQTPFETEPAPFNPN